jgi:hypothetical protein
LLSFTDSPGQDDCGDDVPNETQDRDGALHDALQPELEQVQDVVVKHGAAEVFGGVAPRRGEDGAYDGGVVAVDVVVVLVDRHDDCSLKEEACFFLFFSFFILEKLFVLEKLITQFDKRHTLS